MNRKWFQAGASVAMALLLVSGLSCARNQHLTGINIQPGGGVTFGSSDPAFGLYVNFKAYGTYAHPPVTKDITSQVTWISDSPNVASITANGSFEKVSPDGAECGTSNVTATMQDGGNLVVSNAANVVVDGPAASGCTPAGPQPILTVAFAGTGTGTVTSSPSVISCQSPSACSVQLTTGTTVQLTASATGGKTFSNWTGCNSTSGTMGEICSIDVQNNVTVTATFN